jgi:hypothetical protein
MGESRRTRALLREPLLHFAVAGALLFLANALWAPSRSDRIVVSREIEQGLVAEREELLLRPLSGEEREALIATYIDEEVLLREAYQQGLDRGDPRIRRWLIEQMEFQIDEPPPEPTAADLDRLFREEPERYLTPRALSFDHIFFVSVPEDPEAILSRLRAGEDFTRMGDRFWLGGTLRRFSGLELETTFGPDFTSRLLALPKNEWSGPFSSSRGTHFVRITEIHEPEPRTPEERKWLLREDWLRARRAESRARKLAELRARYRIERTR